MIDPLTFIALLPAVVLVVYICRKDRTDKEPPALLAKLLGFGALSCLPAIVVELILSTIIERLNVRNMYLGYFLEAFVVAGLTEETCKFLFLRTTWRSPAFDFQFDAIVYAVMVALGFAAFENVKYVYSYGFATGLVRAVTAVPGHAIFGVFMGYFYGYAKLSDYWGRDEDRKAYLALSVVVPVLMHGCYDFLAFAQESDGRFTLLFYAYLIALYVFGILRVNRSARADRRVSRETVFDYFRRMQYPVRPERRFLALSGSRSGRSIPIQKGCCHRTASLLRSVVPAVGQESQRGFFICAPACRRGHAGYALWRSVLFRCSNLPSCLSVE